MTFTQPPFWASSPSSLRSQHPVVSIITEPSSEPVTVDDVKTRLGIDADNTTAALDTQMAVLITAARRQVEKDLQGAHLVATVVDQWMDRAPSGRYMDLTRWPVQSVASVKSYDIDDAEATLSSGDYLVDTVSRPGRIILNGDANWPTSLRDYKSVVVRYTVGFTTVPQTYVMAILYLVGFWLRNPEAVSDENLTVMPLAYQSLISDGPVSLA